MYEIGRELVASITSVSNIGIEIRQSMIGVVSPVYEFTLNQPVSGTDRIVVGQLKDIVPLIFFKIEP